MRVKRIDMFFVDSNEPLGLERGLKKERGNFLSRFKGIFTIHHESFKIDHLVELINFL